MPLVTCILVNSEYSVHKRKKQQREELMCAIDHSGVSTGAFFLLSAFLSPPFQFSWPLTLDLSAGPSPWSSLPSGPPGCDLAARRSGLTLLLFCLEGFIDGPCLKAAAPILVALRL